MNRGKELKRAIIDWLFENEHVFNRLVACFDAFREYIYNSEGNYLIGGEAVVDFIQNADKLIYFS